MPTALIVVGVSMVAALASLAGGALAVWRKPTSLLLSVALGFASGAVLATIAFEMIPRARQLGGLPAAAGGTALGLVGLYAFELAVRRGRTAGGGADQRRRIAAFHRRRPPRGDQVTVLGGGTTLEAVVEGISIGVGAAIQPGLAALIALSIALDNLSEALSIGGLIRDRGGSRRRMLGWSGAIGAGLFTAALVGWYVLRGMPDPVLGFLVAFGAGGMLYLTVTDLIPEAQERQYQESAALAAGAGFVVVLLLASLL